MLMADARRRLPKGYDVDMHFNPPYDPWDQRMCIVPDGDLFEAISSGGASVATGRIDRFVPEGIRLESGELLEADVIVTATGLNMLAFGRIAFSVDGEPVDIPETTVFRSMMLSGVPNFAFAVGYTNASWTLKADLTCDYVCRLLNLMRTRGLARCTPRNRDGAVPLGSMLGLSSGYVQRSVDRLPKQGSRAPWQVHQSYLRDWRIVKRGALEDESLELTRRPARVEART
jgi:cation diffusion facilitator CzcD-associated flavoprotein CzcO